ncbi:MAG: hypothetical protein AB7O88_22385 [Reyranellaceae bacterium]
MLRHREFHVALLAIVVGAAALWLMRHLPWGTPIRMGPAFTPGFVAAALVAAGAWHALATALWRTPQRQARTGFDWPDLLPWAVPVGLMLFAVARPEGLLLKMGPAEIAMGVLLVLSLLFAATWIAERGSLTRLAIPLLLGLLVGMGGVDVNTGAMRWLHEEDPGFLHGVFAGAVIVALRLPVVSFIVAFSLAVMLEEQIRRSLLLARGSLLIFLTRPLAAALLVLAVVVLSAAVIGRFRSRRGR